MIRLSLWLCCVLGALVGSKAFAQQSAADVISLDPPRGPHDAEVLEPEGDQHTEEKPNQPRVVISADGEARPGCWFMLDGSASKDPLNYALTFEWRQSAGPLVPLNDQNLKDPRLWLFLVQPGNYRFVLKATNENGISFAREVKFTVTPGQAFLSEHEGRKVTGFGEQVSLPGEGWRQVYGPQMDLRGEDEGYSFRPARAGLYIFEAPRAGDAPERRGVYVPAGRTPPFGDRRPLVYLPKNLAGKANKPLIIDGSLSRHPDGPEETQTLKANWITLDKPRGVEIQDLPGLRARFTATRPGMYEVKLTVSDGKLVSQPEGVFIKIEPEEEENNGIPDALEFQDEPDFYRDDPRYSNNHVKLGLSEGNLDRAVQLFPSRCGAALRVDPELAQPEKFTEIPLALEVMDGPLLHLLDWIGRQTDSWYRRERNVSFWLTRANGWIKDEDVKPRAVQADALSVKPDGSDFMQHLKPWAQRIIDARPGTSLVYDGATQSIVSTLPVSANGRVAEICGALRVPVGNGLPPPEMPAAMEWKLRALLGERKITIKAERYRVDLLLRDISKQAGVAIGMDPRQFPNSKGLPRVTMDVHDASLRDVVRTVVDLAGFDGCSVESPSGLWFYKGARPYPNRELLWDQSIVQAYDISRLLGMIAPISGEMVAHEIQCRVYPDTWTDAGALVFYHAPTGKLLVMHGAIAHRKILELLIDLAERGEWALGAVEEK
jgi:hypothetical protein